MIEFHGRPFLAYLIEQLRGSGFVHIMLLLGYLPEKIQQYFGDGSAFGVRISYSILSPDDVTCRRLEVARHELDPCFLLMYCDNYWPMLMDKMWERFTSSAAAAMVTVYSNRDNYSRDCVRVGEDGYIEMFDRTRRQSGLRGVEISYAIITKPVLDLMRHDAMFEEAVYPALIARRQLLAYETNHRYYSVGSHERLPLTETFLARQPAIILDRDGVLNRRPPMATYIRSWEQFEWLPGALDALQLLKQAGYRIIVASNQAGIARGELTEDGLGAIHKRMKHEAAAAGGGIDSIYYCPHHWDEGCECRKPRPGLLLKAQREFHLDLTRTWFIGDDERDAEAACAAECRSALVSEHQSLLDITCRLLSGKAG
jgi:D-glycero-D-manno-heptose 1,7-bisphosphate phosphatase